jgi:hypothetical protein
VHVRVCIRTWLALKAAETSLVWIRGCLAAETAPTVTNNPTAARRAMCFK